MKNKHGQALIEFVIILPVLILLIFSFIDLGRIVLENNRLETVASMAVDQYSQTRDKDEVLNYLAKLGYGDIDLIIDNNSEKLDIKVAREIDIITPGLNNILGNPYRISVERVVNNE